MLLDSKKIQVVKIPKILSAESVDRFNEELGCVVNKEPTAVELDCSQIDLVTSSHINMLWEARTLCLEHGIQIKLCFIPPGLIRVLKVLDLYEIFLGGSLEPSNNDAFKKGSENQVTTVQEIKLEFKAETNSITRALADFRRFLSKLNLPMKSVIELEIIFYEITTNIRLHSGLNADAMIMFHANSRDNKISMCFIDRGKPFDPTLHEMDFDPNKVIKEKRKQGFGLTMVARMTDQMVYERRDDCLNVLTLEKSWR